MNFKERIAVVKETFVEFFAEKPMAHGAALAYYTLLALIPMLYLAVTYVGMFLGQETMVRIISEVMRESIGLTNIDGVLDLLNMVNFEKANVFIQIGGIIALLFSCGAIFNAMKRSLNDFYDIEVPKKTGKKMILSTVLTRLVSMGFVVGATIVLLLLYFAETVFLALNKRFFEDMEALNWFFTGIAQHGIPIATNVILFTFIFKFLHDGQVQWKMAFRGAVVTSLLLYLGQVLIKFYLGKFFFASGSGIAGSFLVILVWVYYSSQIIFFGAKYIFVLSRAMGCDIQKNPTKPSELEK